MCFVCSLAKQHTVLKWKDVISGFPVSQCSAESLDTWDGKTKHHLISYFLGNPSVKNYRNWMVYVKNIVSKRCGIFETQCTFWILFLTDSIIIQSIKDESIRYGTYPQPASSFYHFDIWYLTQKPWNSSCGEISPWLGTPALYLLNLAIQQAPPFGQRAAWLPTSDATFNPLWCTGDYTARRKTLILFCLFIRI